MLLFLNRQFYKRTECCGCNRAVWSRLESGDDAGIWAGSKSVALQRVTKIKLRSGSRQFGGSVCEINVGEEPKTEEKQADMMFLKLFWLKEAMFFWVRLLLFDEKHRKIQGIIHDSFLGLLRFYNKTIFICFLWPFDNPFSCTQIALTTLPKHFLK